MKCPCLLLLMGACILAPVILNAQQSIKFRGSGGWCNGDRYDQNFINANQDNFVGQVKNIDTITPYPGMSLGIKMVLRTDRDEMLTVHLGPAWYILNQDMKLKIDDKDMEVKGCRASINGTSVIMASWLGQATRYEEGTTHDDGRVRTEVVSHKARMLRDEYGIPYWCAWRPKMR